ncbi:MAG: alpha/beta hydrolase [Bacteroidales bacterium]|nr:alpha/beta hydrolase [Bacteroidales bacterium]
MQASGIISIPEAEGFYPIISFQNGTITENSRAPSKNIGDPLVSFLTGLAGNGFIVVIPDYLGFGASEELLHPYHHRNSNDAIVIDLIKATDEFLAGGAEKAKSNNSLFLMGYSQGGWASMSVFETIENSNVLPYNLAAVSCGAGAYDLYGFTEYITQLEDFAAPYYLPYFIYSHISNGLLAGNVEKYFNEPFASRLPDLFNGNNSGSVINSQLTKK